MSKLFRFLSLVLAAIAGPWLYAEVAPPSSALPAANALPPDLQAELDALQRASWHASGSARASVGWRDNVLLSPFAPIERAFGRGEMEAMLLRPMRNRWEFISFLNGDVLRYFSPPPETGGEQQWALHTEGRWQPIDPARLALKAAGYLRDMVIDLSETEARRVVAPTRVRGGYVNAAVRLTLPGRFSFEPSVQEKRTDYRDYSGDYTETRGGGRVEWRPATALFVSASWFQSDRRYNQRQEFSASGRARPGTHLRFRQREGDVRARTTWTAKGEWSMAATVGKVENRDRSSGYFDYDQKRARLEFGWRGRAWRANLEGEAKRMDYLGQTVGAGIDPPARINDDHEVTVRVERDLSAKWTLFGEQRWERSRSNEVDFSYRANTVLAGVQRNF